MSGLEWDILVRAIVAAALGYIVGAERECIAHRARSVAALTVFARDEAWPGSDDRIGACWKPSELVPPIVVRRDDRREAEMAL